MNLPPIVGPLCDHFQQYRGGQPSGRIALVVLQNRVCRVGGGGI